jgi:poly(A)-specific ribonuclease
MTAELFVKLTAKLYTTHKHLSGTSSPSSETSIELAYSSSSDSDSASGGGASINPLSTSTNGHSAFNLTTLTDNLPPAWHARQLNPFAVLQHDNDEDAEIEAAEPKPRQWIPSMRNPFWDMYANKLRVNAIEGGVCDLEGDESAEE